MGSVNIMQIVNANTVLSCLSEIIYVPVTACYFCTANVQN